MCEYSSIHQPSTILYYLQQDVISNIYYHAVEKVPFHYWFHLLPIIHSFFHSFFCFIRQSEMREDWQREREREKFLQRLRDSLISQTLVFISFSFSIFQSWLNFTYHPESYRSITTKEQNGRPGRKSSKKFFFLSFPANPIVYITPSSTFERRRMK